MSVSGIYDGNAILQEIDENERKDNLLAFLSQAVVDSLSVS